MMDLFKTLSKDKISRVIGLTAICGTVLYLGAFSLYNLGKKEGRVQAFKESQQIVNYESQEILEHAQEYADELATLNHESKDRLKTINNPEIAFQNKAFSSTNRLMIYDCARTASHLSDARRIEGLARYIGKRK